MLHRLALLAVVLLALALRLGPDHGPYDHQDELQLQVFVLDSLPRAGWLESLTRIDHAAVGNPLRLLAYPLSVVHPVIVFLQTIAFDALSVPITERTWPLSTAVLGALTPLAACALVAGLAGRSAGLGAAALLAVTPLHVLLSRSLAAAWAPAFLLELLVLLAAHRHARDAARSAPLLGLALAGYLLAHNQFPSLAPVVIAAMVLFDPDRGPGRGQRAARRLLRPAVFVPPLLVLIGLVAVHVAFDRLWVPEFRSTGPRGVGIVGHMLMRETNPGFHLDGLIREARNGLGLTLAGAAPLALLFWLRRARALGRLALLPIWSLCYVLPFIVLLPPGTTVIRGYLGDGLYPLVLLTGALLGRACEQTGSRVAAITATALLAIGAVTSWATVHQHPMPAGLTLPPFHGSARPDLGVKAAATWLRTQTDDDAKIFSLGIDPKLVRYYARRHAIGQLVFSSAEALACLERERTRVDAVLSRPDTLAEVDAHALAGLHRAAVIRSNDTTLLEIWVPGEVPEGPHEVEVATANKTFDDRYARLAELLPLPDYEACKPWR